MDGETARTTGDENGMREGRDFGRAGGFADGVVRWMTHTPVISVTYGALLWC